LKIALDLNEFDGLGICRYHMQASLVTKNSFTFVKSDWIWTMSQFGNSGPGNGPGGQRPYQPVGPGGNPYNPRQKVVYKKQSGGINSKQIGIIIASIIGVGGLSVLCCCGGLISFGMYTQKSEESDLIALIKDDPVVIEHVGELQQLNTDFMASNNIEDWDVYVYKAVGSKGEAKMVLQSGYDQNGDVTVISGRLIDSQGIEHKLRGSEDNFGFENLPQF